MSDVRHVVMTWQGKKSKNVVQEDFDKLKAVLMFTLGVSEREALGKIDKRMLRKFVRTFVPQPHVLQDRLQQVFDIYSTIEYDGVLLFTNKTWEVHQDCLKHVERGCLSDPENLPLYEAAKKLGNGLTVWKCVKGPLSWRASMLIW